MCVQVVININAMQQNQQPSTAPTTAATLFYSPKNEFIISNLNDMLVHYSNSRLIISAGLNVASNVRNDHILKKLANPAHLDISWNVCFRDLLHCVSLPSSLLSLPHNSAMCTATVATILDFSAESIITTQQQLCTMCKLYTSSVVQNA